MSQFKWLDTDYKKIIYNQNVLLKTDEILDAESVSVSSVSNFLLDVFWIVANLFFNGYKKTSILHFLKITEGIYNNRVFWL